MPIVGRQKLDVVGQINHLCNKGVKFNIASEELAMSYLSKNNNFFRLRAYRKNYPKHPGGENAGKYINLDFEFLKDLATIDMRLRYILIHMALDVEHFAKVKLLSIISASQEDGYSIVADFIGSLSKEHEESLKKEIDRNAVSPYCGDIILKYQTDGFPVWAFLEIIPFGRFVSFYKYCADRFNILDMTDDFFLMQSVKDIRNACAHNNCILNDLKPHTTAYRTNYGVMVELGKTEISKGVRTRKMSNIRIQQIVTLLHSHRKLVASTGVHYKQANELHSLLTRMFRHIDYYKDNGVILSAFHFIKNVVDNWFPLEYTENT